MTRFDALLEPQPLAAATALAANWYTDSAIAAIERSGIFERSWQLVGHVDRLRTPGAAIHLEIAGLPVIAVRGDDGVLRAFHNVCRHRAGPLTACRTAGGTVLRCRYHGWTYGLDGVLRSAPEMDSAADFETRSIRLPKLKIAEWQGLVFAGRSPEMSLDALMTGITSRIGSDRHLERFAFHRHVDYALDCDWKVYVDNFLEGYHVPHIHPELNRLLDYRSYRTEIAEWNSLQSSPLESVESLYGSGDALYYWLWPNTMLNILPGRLQTNRVVPTGTGRCRVEFDFYYAGSDTTGAGGQGTQAQADLDFSDIVQLEDVDICADVQRGLASGSYVPGRLNPLRESGVHHFQELLRRAYRNSDAAPFQSMRAESLTHV